MPVTYFLSAKTEEDIDDIVTYIANENPTAALTFLNALFDAFNKLAENPEMGHLREDLTNRPVKFWTFKWHYLIIYKSVSPIEIIRVLSGYRDLIDLIG